jgi:pantothenate kinase-related protein Tda10
VIKVEVTRDAGGTVSEVQTVTSGQAIELIGARLTGMDVDSPVVVAVDGHSAAGKSTLALRLADKLDAAMVPGDDFYRVMDTAERIRLEPWEGADQVRSMVKPAASRDVTISEGFGSAAFRRQPDGGRRGGLYGRGE